MSNLMDEAIEALRHVPDDQRDDVARAVMHVVRARPHGEIYGPDPEESAELAESEAAALRGEFASDDQVRAVWAKYGL